MYHQHLKGHLSGDPFFILFLQRMVMIDSVVYNYRRGNVFLPAFIIFSILFIIFLLQSLLLGNPAESFVRWPLADMLTLIVLTPLLLKFHRTFRPDFLKYVIIPVILGALQLILKTFIIILLERLFLLPETYGLAESFSIISNQWPAAFTYTIAYFVISGLFYLLDSRLRFLEQEEELQRLRKDKDLLLTDTMNSRMNPHFLFNAMNNIAMVIRSKKTDKAVDMLASLSNLMRRSLDNSNELITIMAEKQFLQEYIKLEMLRYEDKAEVDMQLGDDLDHIKIPKMLLQPLIENAFKYGLGSTQKLMIVIKGRLLDQKLELSVYNNGAYPRHWDLTNPKGIGLHHTIHRLRQYYGDNYSFKIKEEPDGIRFIISIPYHG